MFLDTKLIYRISQQVNLVRKERMQILAYVMQLRCQAAFIKDAYDITFCTEYSTSVAVVQVGYSV